MLGDPKRMTDHCETRGGNPHCTIFQRYTRCPLVFAVGPSGYGIVLGITHFFTNRGEAFALPISLYEGKFDGLPEAGLIDRIYQKVGAVVQSPADARIVDWRQDREHTDCRLLIQVTDEVGRETFAVLVLPEPGKGDKKPVLVAQNKSREEADKILEDFSATDLDRTPAPPVN